MCRYLFVRCDNEPAPWSSEGAPPAHCLATARPHACAQLSEPPLPARAPTQQPARRLGLLNNPWPPCRLPAETGDRPGLETNLPEAAMEEIKNADKGQVGRAGMLRWWVQACMTFHIVEEARREGRTCRQVASRGPPTFPSSPLPLASFQVFSMNDKPWWGWDAEKEVRRRRCCCHCRCGRARAAGAAGLACQAAATAASAPCSSAAQPAPAASSQPLSAAIPAPAHAAGVGLVPRPARQPEDGRRHRRAHGAQEGAAPAEAGLGLRPGWGKQTRPRGAAG